MRVIYKLTWVTFPICSFAVLLFKVAVLHEGPYMRVIWAPCDKPMDGWTLTVHNVCITCILDLWRYTIFHCFQHRLPNTCLSGQTIFLPNDPGFWPNGCLHILVLRIQRCKTVNEYLWQGINWIVEDGWLQICGQNENLPRPKHVIAASFCFTTFTYCNNVKYLP